MKDFKDTLIRHSSRTNVERVKYMADILKKFCIYCLVPDVYSNDERINHINTILPVLEKFESFSTNREYLSKKARDLVEKAQKSVTADPVGFRFALALNELVKISEQGGIDQTILLESINTTIIVLKAKRTMLQKEASIQNVDTQLGASKRRKTDTIDNAASGPFDKTESHQFN